MIRQSWDPVAPGAARSLGDARRQLHHAAQLATAFGFAVQTRAQAVTTPADTAILLTTEPVFAAMAGVSLSGDTLSPRGWLGAGMILVSTLVVAVSQVGRRGRAREGGAPEPGAPPGFT